MYPLRLYFLQLPPQLSYLSQTVRRFADAAKPSMASSRPTSLNVTFLGTASAQPSSTRNHSSLALRLGSDVWLFDCGEATQHQVQRSKVKMGKIQKVFITHTHGELMQSLRPYTYMTDVLCRRSYLWSDTSACWLPQWHGGYF